MHGLVSKVVPEKDLEAEVLSSCNFVTFCSHPEYLSPSLLPLFISITPCTHMHTFQNFSSSLFFTFSVQCRPRK